MRSTPRNLSTRLIGAALVLIGVSVGCAGAPVKDGAEERVCVKASEALVAKLKDGGESPSVTVYSSDGQHTLCFNASEAGAVTLSLKSDPAPGARAGLDAGVDTGAETPSQPPPGGGIWGAVPGDEPVQPPGPPPPIPAAEDSEIIPVGSSPIRGRRDAPVTIVAFSEFQCPFCSRVQPALKQVLEAYPEDVRIVFKHNPLSFHKDAPLAAEAAIAAHAQGRFWEYHDVLFQNQRALNRDDLERYAQQVGLKMGAFRSALDSGRHKEQVRQDQALAAKVGARGTPNFFINGVKFIGAKPFPEFKRVIDDELKDARGSTYVARVKANYKKDPPVDRPGRPSNNDDTIYKVEVGKSPVRGKTNLAQVTIVEFSEFQCPFCSRVQGTLNDLQQEYGDKVRIVYKHLPLPFHKDAFLAAEASLEAHAQGKFWAYHDLLFQNQKALGRDDLERYAKQVGLNMGRFRRALNQRKHKKQVEADLKQARTFGARGTPHFFINGKRLSGAQPIDQFKAAVDDALERAEPLIQKGMRGDRLYREVIKDGATEFKSEAPKREEDTAVYTVPAGNSPAWGNRRAKVTIVEFSDFQCPFCSRAQGTLEQIKKKYGRNKVRIVYKHQPLSFHKDAFLAAEASLAAHAQGKFWAYHDLLYQNQRALSRDDLERYAKQVGLNMKRFRRDLDQHTYKKQVEADMKLAEKVGARGTPTFFINGVKLVGAQPMHEFEERIDAALAGKKK